ncbi:hypothetical protein GCM10010253_64190 [Streptomyces badius]|uniref:Uncharacterized protein n=2 Tax=Streptomyces TaxID=1883 RepID=A0ABQ2TQ75_STRBA|nr:hypothetical protein GCM10010253_64190 [Streptomyces badius]
MTITETTNSTAARGQYRRPDTADRRTPGAGGAPGGRVSVAVYAEDLILQTGMIHQLRVRPEIELLPEA